MSVPDILKAIDREFEVRCKAVHAGYDAALSTPRKALSEAKAKLAAAERALKAAQAKAHEGEKAALAEAQRWRTNARQAASLDARPVRMQVAG